ncbi:hypothetical protein AB7942_30275 [Neobacillus sp. BF23-41]
MSAASFVVGLSANGIDVSSHGWSPTLPLAVYVFAYLNVGSRKEITFR